MGDRRTTRGAQGGDGGADSAGSARGSVVAEGAYGGVRPGLGALSMGGASWLGGGVVLFVFREVHTHKNVYTRPFFV